MNEVQLVITIRILSMDIVECHPVMQIIFLAYDIKIVFTAK